MLVLISSCKKQVKLSAHKMISPIYLIFLLFATTSTRLFEGQCCSIPSPVVFPFNYNWYMGTWYEIEWYDDEYPTYDECIKFTYTKTARNTFNMTLDLKESNNGFASQQYQGHGIVSQPGLLPRGLFTAGKLSTTFDAGPPTRINHQVLATNYKSYAFVWDCMNVNGTYYNERMWYFDRQPNPVGRPVKVQKLISLYFNETYIRKTYQGPKC